MSFQFASIRGFFCALHQMCVACLIFAILNLVKIYSTLTRSLRINICSYSTAEKKAIPYLICDAHKFYLKQILPNRNWQRMNYFGIVWSDKRSIVFFSPLSPREREKRKWNSTDACSSFSREGADSHESSLAWRSWKCSLYVIQLICATL